mmetsp:Transcript_12056/g.34463  ORF Transcript_12056/g.34463 Transcript_12056/m.34463 type:complete len:145 (-) Transcript_12056:1539-1973(-)
MDCMAELCMLCNPDHVNVLIALAPATPSRCRISMACNIKPPLASSTDRARADIFAMEVGPEAAPTCPSSKESCTQGANGSRGDEVAERTFHTEPRLSFGCFGLKKKLANKAAINKVITSATNNLPQILEVILGTSGPEPSVCIS